MNFKQTIKNTVPAPIFSIIRDVPWAVRDLFDRSDQNELMPPLRLMRDGPRGRKIWSQAGEEVVRFYRDVLRLDRSSIMLDIGSGIGRRTIPLLSYLDDRARYVGLDIDPDQVRWCSRNITPRNFRFSFIHIDVFNKFYNHSGAIPASKLVLPFPDNSFDVVSLWSVFTHMYPDDVAHYLAEIGRVLRPGGRLVASYFLMNDDTKAGLKNGTINRIMYPGDRYWTTNPNMPEDMIALDEAWLRGAYADAGLAGVESVLRGRWAGAEVDPALFGLNWQDIVVAQAADPAHPPASSGGVA
ncbi:class I SAM-dependent methyltransferase [Inquilinus limosus]|uniref:class I SAM-dependent methyltransferase n=1 Tax=Inquilinus limosus TaxID=171674 RepID=UPI0003F78061|nr:class I SAM-dependent methyltransferase [Inquilinus limosus]